MDLEYTLKIFLYVIVIIAVLLFILGCWWIYKTTNKSIENHNSSISSKRKQPDSDNFEISESESMSESENEEFGQESPIKRVQPREYTYERLDHGLSISSQPQERESTLRYEEFKDIIMTDVFLKNYQMAIRTSFQEKDKIYKTKYRELLSELKATQKRVGSEASTGFNHDSNLDRLRRSTIEIKEIILALRKRLESLSLDIIKKDLYDAIHDPEHGIDSLIGREDVKDILALQIFTFARNPRLFFHSFQNITIYGSSGVGKTKLAETIGFVFSKSGILIRKKVRSVTKQEFTSSYVNESAQLTRELLMSTLEGVLFIDEAYDLCPPKSTLGRGIDHGHEAVTELVNFLDKNIGLSIVIAAGYEDEMEERFMGANQGLSRRFPHQIRLKDYNSRQLTDILLKFMGEYSDYIKLSNVEAGYIYTVIDFLCQNVKGIFSKQAGDMLNLSNVIVRSIYGAIGSRWSSTDYRKNALMLLNGFNDYLRDKGISISPGDFNFCNAYDLPTPGRINSLRNTPKSIFTPSNVSSDNTRRKSIKSPGYNSGIDIYDNNIYSPKFVEE